VSVPWPAAEPPSVVAAHWWP